MFDKGLYLNAVASFEKRLPPTFNPKNRLFINGVQPGLRAQVIRFNHSRSPYWNLLFLSSARVNNDGIITADVLITVEDPPVLWQKVDISLTTIGVAPITSLSKKFLGWSSEFYTRVSDLPKLNRLQLFRFWVVNYFLPHIPLWINKLWRA